MINVVKIKGCPHCHTKPVFPEAWAKNDYWRTKQYEQAISDKDTFIIYPDDKKTKQRKAIANLGVNHA